MPLNSAQMLRLTIQDVPAVADTTYYGDGTATVFALPHQVITTASAYVPVGGTAWSATAATFTSGEVAFSNVISANSAFRTRYTYSVFSDDDIGYFSAAGGGINGGALEAVKALMFDAVKRASWTSPDGAEYDDTQAQAHLREMYKDLQLELEKEATIAGGVQSWSLNQGSY